MGFKKKQISNKWEHLKKKYKELKTPVSGNWVGDGPGRRDRQILVLLHGHERGFMGEAINASISVLVEKMSFFVCCVVDIFF